jgi:hypothetical protein
MPTWVCEIEGCELGFACKKNMRRHVQDKHNLKRNAVDDDVDSRLSRVVWSTMKRIKAGKSMSEVSLIPWSEFNDDSTTECRRMLVALYPKKIEVESDAKAFYDSNGLQDIMDGMTERTSVGLKGHYRAIMNRNEPGDRLNPNYTDAMADERETELREELKFIEYGRILRASADELSAYSVVESVLDDLK